MSLCLLVEAAFSFKHLTKKKEHDTKNRMVAILHGLYGLIMSGYHLLNERPSYIEKSTDLQHFIVLTSMGYFIYDFLACEFLGISDIGLVVHHSLAIAGYAACEYYEISTISIGNILNFQIVNSFDFL